jgi:putative Mg2+ transporter-C (MgtC) family protein
MRIFSISFGGLTVIEIIGRLVMAAVIGGVLGLERKSRNRALGLRSYLLVCLGSCLLAILSECLYQIYQVGDPNRLTAQVISAVALLGAGSVIITREKQIEGLTTAIGLWVVAGIGIAIGMGFYLAAILTGILVFISFTALERFETFFLKKRKYNYFYVELRSIHSLPAFLNYLEQADLKIETQTIQKSPRVDKTVIGLSIKLMRQSSQSDEEVLTHIARFPDLIYVSSDNKMI